MPFEMARCIDTSPARRYEGPIAGARSSPGGGGSGGPMEHRGS